jgi:hypothetical protein
MANLTGDPKTVPRPALLPRFGARAMPDFFIG